MKTKKQKHEEAVVRQEEYDALPLNLKIERAASRRGESRKEIARLQEEATK